MKKYVHVGVPTDKVMEGSIYAEGIKTHIVPPETNEFGIEYLRFEKDTPLPQELQTMVHVAFMVDDMDESQPRGCRTVDGRRTYPHRLYHEGWHFDGINGRSKIIADR